MSAARRAALRHLLHLGVAGALWRPLAPMAAAPTAGELPGDPFASMPWPDMQREYLGPQARVRFDERVQVLGPGFAEDPMNVPISVRVDPALGSIERIVILVDRNPIRQVLIYQPLLALPALAFRFKLEQASPVRAAALAADGVWHVGGVWVDSSGGGCTVSGASRKDGSWAQTLGEVSGRMFAAVAEPAAASSTTPAAMTSAAAAARLRLRVMHPMDTGLVSGVPAFYINRLSVRDGQDRELARLQPFEPVSENPVFSFDFAQAPAGGVRVVGTDNNGNRLSSAVGGP